MWKQEQKLQVSLSLRVCVCVCVCVCVRAEFAPSQILLAREGICCPRGGRGEGTGFGDSCMIKLILHSRKNKLRDVSSRNIAYPADPLYGLSPLNYRCKLLSALNWNNIICGLNLTRVTRAIDFDF